MYVRNSKKVKVKEGLRGEDKLGLDEREVFILNQSLYEALHELLKIVYLGL